MKPTTVCIASIFLCLQPLIAIAQPTKRALIVGISEYPKHSGWNNLMTDMDVQLVRAALIKQGFPEKNIAVLRNDKATKQGIVGAIEQQLIAPTTPGDIVYFHFSGHGQQVADYSGDEIDRYDEALVPYDAPKIFDKDKNTGTKHLLDDDLGVLMNRIRAKAGGKGQLITVIDACHSGTALRSSAAAGFARGTLTKLAPDDWEKRAIASESPAKEEQMEGLSTSATLAPIASFFASGAGQLNFEVSMDSTRVGPLSYAFSKHFGDCPPNASYRGLFYLIRDEMAAIRRSDLSQDPEVEGNALDNLVLNGAVAAQSPFFRVAKTVGSGELHINGGYLQGLTKGSVLGFYDKETPEPHKITPREKATVEESSPFSCVVSVSSASKLKNSWVYLLEHDPGVNKLRLTFDFQDGSLLSEWKQALKREKFIVADPSAPNFILSQQQDSVLLLNTDGSRARQHGFTTAAYAGAIETLKGINQARTLRKLDSGRGIDGMANFKLEIYPVEERMENGKTTLVSLPASNLIDPASNKVVIPEGTKVRIRIIYQGNKACYLTLIDLQPDDVVNILAPLADESPSQYRFSKKGEMIDIPKRDYFTISEPFGAEMLKLIVTDTPEDLRPALSRSRTRSAHVRSPLQNAFFDTFLPDDLSTRGPTRIPSEVTFSSYPFYIVPTSIAQK